MLVRCRECRNKISSLAPNCVKCGAPNAAYADEQKLKAAAAEQAARAQEYRATELARAAERAAKRKSARVDAAAKRNWFRYAANVNPWGLAGITLVGLVALLGLVPTSGPGPGPSTTTQPALTAAEPQVSPASTPSITGTIEEQKAIAEIGPKLTKIEKGSSEHRVKVAQDSGRSLEVKILTYQEVQKDAVRSRLRNPKSAKFSDVMTGSLKGTPIVCGRVNGENGFGGMTGAQRFISGGPITVVEEEMADGEMDNLWNTICLSPYVGRR